MSNTQVSLIGNLTRDPEVRFTATGLTVVNFSVAVNEGTKEAPRTSFYDVTAWRELGQNAADSLAKGQRVLIVGTLNQRSWETPDGQKRSKVEVTAEAIGPDLRFDTAHVTKAGVSAPAPAYGTSEDPFDDEPF